jgi:hypothetical protein
MSTITSKKAEITTSGWKFQGWKLTILCSAAEKRAKIIFKNLINGVEYSILE